MIARAKYFIIRGEPALRMFLGVFFLVVAALKLTQATTTQNGFVKWVCMHSRQ